jgi:hypothetical protein
MQTMGVILLTSRMQKIVPLQTMTAESSAISRFFKALNQTAANIQMFRTC